MSRIFKRTEVFKDFGSGFFVGWAPRLTLGREIVRGGSGLQKLEIACAGKLLYKSRVFFPNNVLLLILIH